MKNLTGNKIGALTVINRAPSKFDKSGKPRVMWNCKCDCGNNDVVVSTDYLRISNCPSCGCEASKSRSEKNRINNIGEKFGRLTIVDILWGNAPVRAVCKCDCGNDYIGIKTDITSGHTQSCGCLQSEKASEANTKDWTGHVSNFGVEFLSQDSMNDKGQWLWKCRCGICGNVFVDLPARINSGHVTSCGCRVQSSGEEYIQNLLEDMNVNFKPQYTFADCKNKYPLHFDFAIFNCEKVIGLIEYDGKQHFEAIDWFGGEDGFRKTKQRDEIKNTYCKSHDIPLLRLPYTLSIDEIKKQIHEYYLSLTTAGCA